MLIDRNLMSPESHLWFALRQMIIEFMRIHKKSEF